MREYLYGDGGYSEYLRVNATSIEDAVKKIERAVFKNFEGEVVSKEIGLKTFVLVIKLSEVRTYEYICLGTLNDIKEIES